MMDAPHFDGNGKLLELLGAWLVVVMIWVGLLLVASQADGVVFCCWFVYISDRALAWWRSRSTKR